MEGRKIKIVPKDITSIVRKIVFVEKIKECNYKYRKIYKWESYFNWLSYYDFFEITARYYNKECGQWNSEIIGNFILQKEVGRIPKNY